MRNLDQAQAQVTTVAVKAGESVVAYVGADTASLAAYLFGIYEASGPPQTAIPHHPAPAPTPTPYTLLHPLLC